MVMYTLNDLVIVLVLSSESFCFAIHADYHNPAIICDTHFPVTTNLIFLNKLGLLVLHEKPQSLLIVCFGHLHVNLKLPLCL
jgi:hypothetical protein